MQRSLSTAHREEERRERHPLALLIPPEIVEQVAQRVAHLVELRLRETSSASTPWLDSEAARAYLGFSADQLYKLTAAKAIPFRKIGQRLLFHRQELDEWLETAFPRLDRPA